MVNNVTFNIIETPEGDIVLYLRNRSLKKLSEVFRSKNLDEVVAKFKYEIERRKHHKNAFENYIPVLARLNDIDKKNGVIRMKKIFQPTGKIL